MRLTKKIIKILESAVINVKWNNMGTWVKEDYTNLLDFVYCEGINIVRDSKISTGNWTIHYNFGRMKTKTYTNIYDIESDLYTLLAQKCLYLGDKVKIVTRKKDWNF